MNGRKPKLSAECIKKLKQMAANCEPEWYLARLFRLHPRTVRAYLQGRHKHG